MIEKFPKSICDFCNLCDLYKGDVPFLHQCQIAPMLVIGALSMIITERSARSGLHNGRILNSINSSNNSIGKEPWRTSQVMKPSTVYVGSIDQCLECLNSLYSWAVIPFGAHPNFLLLAQLFAANLSTKINWSALQPGSFYIYCCLSIGSRWASRSWS